MVTVFKSAQVVDHTSKSAPIRSVIASYLAAHCVVNLCAQAIIVNILRQILIQVQYNQVNYLQINIFIE